MNVHQFCREFVPIRGECLPCSMVSTGAPFFTIRFIYLDFLGVLKRGTAVWAGPSQEAAVTGFLAANPQVMSAVAEEQQDVWRCV